MPDDRILAPGLTLAQALRALPLESPPQSAWPALAAKLPATRRRTPRWPLALAASLLAGLALTLAPGNRPTAPEPGATHAASDPVAQARLDALMAESAQLESLVAAASDDGASSATVAALGLALQDQLQLIDAQLQANAAPSQQFALWQQRVSLLRDVAGLESSRHYLAAEGRGLDLAMVSTY
jgi:hypothetical protein